MATNLMGGSPVSDTTNPFRDGAGTEAQDILPTLNVEAVITAAMDNLDAYGSMPVTSDAATQRPANPPSASGSIS